MKILAIQNRMGIGDMVIFLPYIEAISKQFSVPVSILVKENSKAIQFLSDNQNIGEIIILDRDNKNKKGRHDGIIGTYNLVQDIKNYNFDKIFIFNSSLRFALVAKAAGIENIYQYPLFKKKNQHITNTASEFIEKILQLKVDSDPKIYVKEQSVKDSKLKYSISNQQINVLLGIGGSGSTKRIPSKIFIEFMSLVDQKYDCKFFLATGKNSEEQKILNEILDTKFNKKCFALDNLDINEILPVIKSCNISICNDSSFSHLSSGLGINTIVLLADTPLIYGNYSSKMYPIIPDGEDVVTHNTLGKNKINPNKIFEKFKILIN